MKFFPSDWRGDPRLRMCSIGARGLWIEMMCIMHEAEPYGSLLVNGVPVDEKKLAALGGMSQREVKTHLAELMEAGVFSVDNGIIYSRRMRRDDEKAERDKANGSKGGNPKLIGGVNPGDKAHIPYSTPTTKTEEIKNSMEGGKRGPPKHGAISRERGTVFIRDGTEDWKVYAADYRSAFGCDPLINEHGGYWFKWAGAAPLPTPKRLETYAATAAKPS